MDCSRRAYILRSGWVWQKHGLHAGHDKWSHLSAPLPTTPPQPVHLLFLSVGGETATWTCFAYLFACWLALLLRITLSWESHSKRHSEQTVWNWLHSTCSQSLHLNVKSFIPIGTMYKTIMHTEESFLPGIGKLLFSVHSLWAGKKIIKWIFIENITHYLSLRS